MPQLENKMSRLRRSCTMKRNSTWLLTLICVLLLPLTSHAWTLMVKVTGPAGVAGDNVALTGGTTGTITSGTVYRYPTTAATATINTAAGYTRTVKVDGNPNAGTSFTYS